MAATDYLDRLNVAVRRRGHSSVDMGHTTPAYVRRQQAKQLAARASVSQAQPASVPEDSVSHSHQDDSFGSLHELTVSPPGSNKGVRSMESTNENEDDDWELTALSNADSSLSKPRSGTLDAHTDDSNSNGVGPIANGAVEVGATAATAASSTLPPAASSSSASSSSSSSSSSSQSTSVAMPAAEEKVASSGLAGKVNGSATSLATAASAARTGALSQHSSMSSMARDRSATEFRKLTSMMVQRRNSLPGAMPIKEQSEHPGQEDQKNGVIKDWDSATNQDLIHRRGLKSPAMVCELNVADERPFFQLFLPQTSAFQQESCLVCRSKRKEKKFRFSLDPTKMQKRNNPNYIGKMTYYKSNDDFLVSLASGTQLATIHVDSTTAKLQKHVRVEILEENANLYEQTSDGRTLSGLVQAYVQPLVSLKVESTKRCVLEIAKPSGVPAPGGPRSASVMVSSSLAMQSHKYLIEFDYPLTIFLSFAVLCAVESNRLELLNDK